MVGEFLGILCSVLGVVDSFVCLDLGIVGGVVFYWILDCDLRGVGF